MVKNKRGQSTLEYIILVTAVLVVVLSFLLGNNSPFQSKLNKTLNQTTQVMDQMSSRWINSLNFTKD